MVKDRTREAQMKYFEVNSGSSDSDSDGDMESSSEADTLMSEVYTPHSLHVTCVYRSTYRNNRSTSSNGSQYSS